VEHVQIVRFPGTRQHDGDHAPAVTWVTGTLDRMIARMTLVLVVLLAGACGGDDDGGSDAARSTTSAVTEAPRPEGAAPECETIQVLLKLDVTDEQREDVAGILDGIDGVEHEFVEAAADTEASMFLVTPSTEEASGAVGTELSGHPAVVSVVFPEQLC
jgi:hypothetical protein